MNFLAKLGRTVRAFGTHTASASGSGLQDVVVAIGANQVKGPHKETSFCLCKLLALDAKYLLIDTG